jgi:putative intracellular protease/amidase
MIFSSHDAPEMARHIASMPLQAFVAPYYVFEDAGAKLTLATPLGGEPPLGRNRRSPAAASQSVVRFMRDTAARALFADTIRLDQVYAGDFDGVFFAAGLEAWWDLAASEGAGALVSAFFAQDKPVAFVGGGQVALLNATDADGNAIVAGKAVTGLPDSEVQASGLAGAVPFSLEAELRARGGVYRRGPDGEGLVVRDGRLITGQNAASAAASAEALLVTPRRSPRPSPPSLRLRTEKSPFRGMPDQSAKA